MHIIVVRYRYRYRIAVRQTRRAASSSNAEKCSKQRPKMQEEAIERVMVPTSQSSLKSMLRRLFQRMSQARGRSEGAAQQLVHVQLQYRYPGTDTQHRPQRDLSGEICCCSRYSTCMKNEKKQSHSGFLEFRYQADLTTGGARPSAQIYRYVSWSAVCRLLVLETSMP